MIVIPRRGGERERERERERGGGWKKERGEERETKSDNP